MVIAIGALVGGCATAIGGAVSDQERLPQMWVGAELRDDGTSGLTEVIDYDTGLATFIDGFGAIADTRGRPHRFGAATDIAGLYFVGFRNPSTGALREMALEAPRVAAALAAQLAAQSGSKTTA